MRRANGASRWACGLLTIALLSFALVAHAAEPQVGRVDLLIVEHSSSARTSDGSSSSSGGRDTVLERVIASTDHGLIVEYAAPSSDPGEAGDPSWQLPARVLKRSRGPTVLLNRDEMEARLAHWLAGAGWPQDVCRRVIFTWNAFRIECDPGTVPVGLARFDPGAGFPGPGGRLVSSGALGSAPLRRTTGARGGARYVAKLPVDADAVRRDRATTDVEVANIAGGGLSLGEALLARAEERVAGTVEVTFEVGADGVVRRRSDVTRLTIRRPDGVVESQVNRQVVKRRNTRSGNRAP